MGESPTPLRHIQDNHQNIEANVVVYGTIFLVSHMEPTARQRRILANLKDSNLIWEVVGQRFFLQFDNRTEREIRIRPGELDEMSNLGWIRLVQSPKAEQRLDRYDLADRAPILEDSRKPPRRESQGASPIQARRRG